MTDIDTRGGSDPRPDAEAFAAALSDRCEIIRVDWPAQGRSGPDRQPPSAARYAQLLVLLLDRLDVREPVIVGNSIGGAAALLFAKQRPVKALVLCDAGGLVAVNGLVRLTCRLFAAFFAAGERGEHPHDRRGEVLAGQGRRQDAAEGPAGPRRPPPLRRAGGGGRGIVSAEDARPPEPSPEHRRLDAFAGTWRTEGRMEAAGPARPGLGSIPWPLLREKFEQAGESVFSG